jgi:adenylate cyclase
MRSLFQNLTQSAVVPVLLSGAIALLNIAAVRLGAFEPLELRIYDWMMRSRSDLNADPRLLIVGITETDLRRLKTVTVSDRPLAEVLQTLQKHKPRVIGIDLYRDLPEGKGQAQLKQQLQASNVIMINRIGDQIQDTIPAPPGIPLERTGFNDVIVDSDGVIRRSLIFAGQETSFAMQIAFTYLEKEKILPEESSIYPGILKLGQSTFLPLEFNSGAYRTVDSKGHQILLNYRGLHVARQVSLTELLEGKFEPNWIKDKIVLIGNVAVSGKDFFLTPYSPSQRTEHLMSGVAIHGQVVSQILDAATGTRALISYIPNQVEWFWIAGWAFLNGLLAWRSRNLFFLEFANVGMLSAIATVSIVTFNQGFWLPIVAPVVGAVASHTTVVIYRTQMLQRQNRMAMTLLGQNTSQKVAQALWDNRHALIQSGKLPGQPVIATMMFTDLRGFSKISESLSPEALLNWLNEYLSVMTEEVHRHHGIVNKFTGDGLFAVFGVPIPRTSESEIAQDAQNAVACALSMRQRLDELNQEWCDRGLNPVQMRVGICTGKAVVGSLGSKDRSEYGVIGDTVNIASRLESCAKERQSDGCRILVSESTEPYLRDRFDLEPWGKMELAGKQQLVEVFRVSSFSS